MTSCIVNCVTCFLYINLRLSFPEKKSKNGPKTALHAKRNTYEGRAEPGLPARDQRLERVLGRRRAAGRVPLQFVDPLRTRPLRRRVGARRRLVGYLRHLRTLLHVWVHGITILLNKCLGSWFLGNLLLVSFYHTTLHAQNLGLRPPEFSCEFQNLLDLPILTLSAQRMTMF